MFYAPLPVHASHDVSSCRSHPSGAAFRFAGLPLRLNKSWRLNGLESELEVQDCDFWVDLGGNIFNGHRNSGFLMLFPLITW